MTIKAEGPEIPPRGYQQEGPTRYVPLRDPIEVGNVPVGQGGKTEENPNEIKMAKDAPTDPPKKSKMSKTDKAVLIGGGATLLGALHVLCLPAAALVDVALIAAACSKTVIKIEPSEAEATAGAIINNGGGGGGDNPPGDDKVNDPTDLIWKKLGVGGNIGTGDQLDDYVDNGLTGHVFNAIYIHGYAASVDFDAPIDDTHKDNTTFTGGFDDFNTGADPTNPDDDVKIKGTAEYYDDNHNSVLITSRYADGGIKEKALYVPAAGNERIVYVYDFGKADDFNNQNPKNKSTINDVMEFNEEERAKILNNQIYSRPGEWKPVDDVKSKELDLIANSAPRVQMKTRSGNTKDIPDDCNKFYKTEANGVVCLYIKGENGWWSQDCSLEVTNRQLKK